MELNKIYNEDCLETMKRMPDNFVDLVLTDPPYGINYQSNARINKFAVIENDFELTLPLDEIKRILKNTGCLLFFFSWKNPPTFKLKSKIVWIKNHFSMGDLTREPGNQYEEIGFIPMDDFKFRRKRPGNVYFAERVDPGKMTHPTEKPVKLLKKLILDYIGNGLIYDPFCGTGSTLVACDNMECDWIGSELCRDYTIIGNRRLSSIPYKLNLTNKL